MINVGVRVIRGPDWDPTCHDDGGPGHLGTIIDLSRKSQTCTVQWDNGHLTNCQASCDKQDLKIVFTDGPVSKHFSQFAYCDVCKTQENIRGIRYKCVTCKDYDLCTRCYMADEHDKTHPFVRIDSRLAKVVPVLPRVKSKKIKLFGFGPGATVILTPFSTSPHSEDIGMIKELVETDGGSVNVEWPDDKVTTLSMGKDGLVEIKMVESHHVGHVYIDHLPLADMSLPIESCINVGDKVCVDINLDTFKGLMQDYGGWNEDMEKIMGETGEVVAIPTNNQCEVYYKSASRTWIIYIATLRKVSVPDVGDNVTVIADVNLLKRRQRYYWKDEMRNLIGKTGRVENIDELGNLSIKFSGKSKFVFSPSCVVKEDPDSKLLRQQESSSSSESDDDSTVKITIADKDHDSKRIDTQEVKTMEPLPYCDDESDGDVSSDEEHEPKINTSMIIAPGLRVVRGRDWTYGDQDGGEGYLGTVTAISGVGRNTIREDKCASVLWDNSKDNSYRIGFQDSYDLRIYDNASVAGNRHCDIKCTEVTCEDQDDDIMGFVWQCDSNPNITLCNNCYHADKGDVNLPFRRIEYPGHKGAKVPKRQTTQRKKLVGIDVGAKVVRGKNWRWVNQDGGPGQQGEVIAIVNFSLDTDRDAAEVTWGNEHTNVYRLGFEGSVDLKLVEGGLPKYYYPLHLPDLKMPEQPIHIPYPEDETPVPDFDDGRLNPGDNVQIGVDPDVLKSIHTEMKVWKEQMMETIGFTGTVKGIDNGMVAVEFNGERYSIHEMALKKVVVFKAGEFVQILNDQRKVQKLQNGHGDWNDFTRKSIGKKGQVQSVNPDGDVKVRFGEVTLTYNPECLSKTEGPADVIGMVVELPTSVREPSPPPIVTDHRNPSVDFKTAVEEGVEDDVLIHLNKEMTVEKKRALVKGTDNFHPVYMACKNGHAGVLKALLKFAGPQTLNEGDEKSTPLQIAVKKKHSDCVDLLLNYNVDKDAVNDHSQSAVHLAVQNRDIKTLRVLRKHECNINQKDALGDSPVVDAIVRQQGDNMEMLKVILDWPGIDLDFENKNGFSPIHIAARKGDLEAVKSLLNKDRKLLNKVKKDGYTPLHLAACMDHQLVVDYLLQQPGLMVDAKTKDKGQTALLIACYYGSKKTVEMLFSDQYNCQADMRDRDGNNALHLCLSGPPQVMEIADIQRPGHKYEEDKQIKPQLELAQFLVEKGVPYMVKNNNGKLPEELCSVDKLQTEFKSFINSRSNKSHQLCPLCQEDGNEVYAVYEVQPCGCSLCNGCFMPKFKKCPNCGISIQSYNKLRRK